MNDRSWNIIFQNKFREKADWYFAYFDGTWVRLDRIGHISCFPQNNFSLPDFVFLSIPEPHPSLRLSWTYMCDI